MQRPTALVLAIVTAGAAIGIVAADLVWNLNVRVEAQTDSGWRTLVDTSEHREAYGAYPVGEDCVTAGRDMRLTFDNDKPLPDTVEIRVRYYNESAGNDRTLFEDTWSLGAFESRAENLTVPMDARQDGSRTDPFPKGGQVMIEYDRARSGYFERNLGFCVEEGS